MTCIPSFIPQTILNEMSYWYNMKWDICWDLMHSRWVIWGMVIRENRWPIEMRVGTYPIRLWSVRDYYHPPSVLLLWWYQCHRVGGGGEGEHVTLNTQQYTVLRIDSKVRTEEARVSNATHTQQYTVWFLCRNIQAYVVVVIFIW